MQRDREVTQSTAEKQRIQVQTSFTNNCSTVKARKISDSSNDLIMALFHLVMPEAVRQHEENQSIWCYYTIIEY